MQKPLTGNSAEEIKKQYNQGPQAQPTAEELEKLKKEDEQKLDAILPYMRKQKEYNELKVAMLETEVLLGNMSPRQVGGLLGLELMVREVQANGFLAQWVAGQQDAAKKEQMQKTMQEQEKAAKEQWVALTDEQRKQYTENAEKQATERNIMDAFTSLTEDQRINVIMQMNTQPDAATA